VAQAVVVVALAVMVLLQDNQIQAVVAVVGATTVYLVGAHQAAQVLLLLDTQFKEKANENS
jgi:preprotein translocase subunit SecG